MYSGLKKIEEIIEYIEENITSEIDCRELASRMALSTYEFRRIFAFVVGCPLSEYIRKRRLSLAACELILDENADISAVSQKYGYSNQSAFTKAFSEQHKISPGALAKQKGPVNVFTKPHFSLEVSGIDTVSISIINESEFTVYGMSGISSLSDTCCCEAVWQKFYDTKPDEKICNIKDAAELTAVYQNHNDDVVCTIGARNIEAGELDAVTLPASKWACFTLNSTDDDYVNEIYSKITYEWLTSAGLEKNESIPVIEVYPFDMSQENFNWEINKIIPHFILLRKIPKQHYHPLHQF